MGNPMENQNNFDVVVIGAGPGGYVAAIRCAQLGLRTACADAWLDKDGKPALGGTCLNVGCIPSKALLDSSHHYAFFRHEAAAHGINSSGVTLDIHRMIERKSRIVKMLTQGIAGLFRKNKVEWLPGRGRILSVNTVEVTPAAGAQHPGPITVNTRCIIIATGSLAATIPPAPVDDELIVDSTGALEFNDVPRRLGIIGAGVIGLELGSVWNRLGSEVVILEALDEFLVPVDRQIATEAEKVLRKQGLDIRLGARVTGTGSNNREVKVTYEDQGGKQQLSVDKLIVAVGRKPNSEGLGLDRAGVRLDDRGFIEVDQHCRTSQQNIYAIGDVVRGPMLAHKAAEEGMAVAEHIAGSAAAQVNYRVIPWVIYTWPEIAWVGSTARDLEQAGIAYRTGVFPFAASGRARAMGDTTGMVKMLCDQATDRILGVHIIGAYASELISEAVLAMEFDGCSEDIARTIHAHPTLTEVMHEAALGVEDRAIHI